MTRYLAVTFVVEKKAPTSQHAWAIKGAVV